MTADSKIAEPLCLACGLCCNGVLFKDVELQPPDDQEKLGELGLKKTGTKIRFSQPCAAFCAENNNRCRIYRDRPTRCREFECALLQAVAMGKQDVPSALRVIRTTRLRAQKVLRLLRELGDLDESMALSRRFRRMQRQMEAGQLTEATAETYGELTLAVQDLNLALSSSFYP